MDNLTPEQIQQMISMLQAMLPKNNNTSDNSGEISNKPKSKPRSRKPKSTNNASTKPARINKFDQMMESRMHKEDIAIDKKLSVAPPVPRARPFELLEVSCRVCGKKEKVNPVLVTDSIDRYKCNKCSTGAG